MCIDYDDELDDDECDEYDDECSWCDGLGCSWCGFGDELEEE